MRTSLLLFSTFVLIALPGIARSDEPTPTTDPVQEHLDWQTERFEALRAPNGWTTLIGLTVLEEGHKTLGADPGSDLPLESPRAPRRAGVLEIDETSVSFRPEEDVLATIDGRTIHDPELLLSDHDDDGPTVVTIGPISFFVIERSGKRLLRSRDEEHPARQELEAIPVWPFDPKWRLEATFHPHETPTTLPVPNVIGSIDESPSPGRIEFEIEGTRYGIDALDGGDGMLFLVFGDLTNKRETYGGGRFLYAGAPGPNGAVLLDFNRAYNPPCAFTPWATCPLPPRSNRLDLSIRAGEKRPAGH